ncbi:MAG: hypothetical protein Q7K98_00735 [Candidatus Omnitrophota bacterium]|nr:hypothetical protein [Candidatus Omnitrophota bacterium]
MTKLKLIFSFLFLSLFIFASARAEVISSFWRTEKSQHFIVYYQQANPTFVSELINKAEDYYNGIMEELGYRRFDFWSWDNRAKIYLYDNADDFHKETQREGWTGAIVSVPNRTIQSYVGQSGFFDSLLPHEMTHIIFREFIGKQIALPLWIDEGVACSQEKSSLLARMRIATELVTQGQYLTLDELSKVSKLDDKITPRVFYSEAASIIVFLIQKEGKTGFLDFSRALRDGTDWKKALLKTYNFSSLQEMEEKWKEMLCKM